MAATPSAAASTLAPRAELIHSLLPTHTVHRPIHTSPLIDERVVYPPAISTKIAAMPTLVQDSSGFDALLARKELLKYGIIAVNDMLGESIPSIQDELFDVLGHAADAMDIVVNKIATGFGPVYIFRDKNRMPLKLAREIVFLHVPQP